MNNAQEAKAYLTRLRAIVQYLGISNANMEEGSFRTDVNISVRKKGETELGTKVELKNINSFKFITNAINYEVERQIQLLEENKEIKQETRSWSEKQHKTVFMRSKDDSFDYRFFTEPDLPLLIVDDEWLERLR